MPRGIRNFALSTNYFICFLLCLWMAFPVLYRNTPGYLVALLFSFWLLTSIFVAGKVIVNKTLIFVFLWMCVMLFYHFIGMSSVNFLVYAQHFFFWLPLYMFFFYRQFGNKRTTKKLIYSVIICLCLSYLLNAFLLAKYPNAISEIGSDSSSGFLMMNIGLTPFAFASALTSLLALFCITKTHSVKDQIFFLALLACSIVNVIAMQRAIAILVLIVGVVLFLLFSKKVRGSKPNSTFSTCYCSS